MRRRVKLDVELPGGLPTAAGIKDPVTYRVVKAILDAIHNLKVDVNPPDKRKISDNPLSLNAPALNIVQDKVGIDAGLSAETTEDAGRDLSEIGAITPASAIGGGGGGGTTLPDGSNDYEVAQWQSGAWATDWVRFHA